jgi:hypothetical protein
MQEEGEAVPGEISCRMRKRLSCWNTMQEEGEGGTPCMRGRG